MPAEHPTLFSVEMIRANRAGKKRMTRRRIVLPRWSTEDWKDFEIDKHGKPVIIAKESGCLAEILCPFGVPGDTLWVRESFSLPAKLDATRPLDIDEDLFRAKIHYTADGPAPAGYGRTRASMFLPRFVSRDQYIVKAVRPEELMDISEKDAIAEGIELLGRDGLRHKWKSYDAPGHFADPRRSYRSLWEFLNGPGSWLDAGMVWVVEYVNPGSTNGYRK